jgi:hypothetical protein
MNRAEEISEQIDNDLRCAVENMRTMLTEAGAFLLVDAAEPGYDWRRSKDLVVERLARLEYVEQLPAKNAGREGM